MLEKTRKKNRIIAGSAMLSAVAVILQYLEINVPLMPNFIKLDLSDLPSLIGSFAYGPLAGCLISILKNIIHLLVSQSGFVGELSNCLLACLLCLPAGLIYQKHKNKKAALIGGLTGSIIMAIGSYPINLYLIYPLYISILGFPMEAILAMYQVINPNINNLSEALLLFNLPFTLIKGLIDVFLCMLIYKRISPILHGIK